MFSTGLVTFLQSVQKRTETPRKTPRCLSHVSSPSLWRKTGDSWHRRHPDRSSVFSDVARSKSHADAPYSPRSPKDVHGDHFWMERLDGDRVTGGAQELDVSLRPGAHSFWEDRYSRCMGAMKENRTHVGKASPRVARQRRGERLAVVPAQWTGRRYPGKTEEQPLLLPTSTSTHGEKRESTKRRSHIETRPPFSSSSGFPDR